MIVNVCTSLRQRPLNINNVSTHVFNHTPFIMLLNRLRFDLTYYYKTLHNLTPFNPDKVFRIYTPLEASRSNSPYLQKPSNANSALLSSFFYRSSDAWNYLPSNLRHAPSASAFKKAVKCIDLSKFLKGASVRQ